MNDTVIFTGPSLSEEAARMELSATYLPPAGQGDVLRALRAGARRIGIIDGYFNHVPSVWHKEILLALEEGTVVFGAASMGALRAAELHPFGMVGVGRVFEWYRDGVLTDDDEVAVIHGPAESGFVAQSEALVNIRDAASAAAENRVVSPDMARRLVDIAKSQFYPERSYPSLARLALQQGVEREPLDAFVAFAKGLEPVKRQDARALLRKMSESGSDPLPQHSRTRVERTFFLERLRGQIELELAVSQSKAQAELSPNALNDLRKRTLLRVLAIKHASDLGMVASPEETQAMADDFRLARQLISPEEMQAWLLAADLTLERFSEVVRELATVRKLEQHYALEVERRLASHLQLGLGRER